MDDDKKPMPSDHVDTLRTWLNQLSKLAPELDTWVYMKEDKSEYAALDTLTDLDTVEAARAAISGAYQLRKALFCIEHVAQEIVEARENQQAGRMDAFFGSEEER